MSDLYIELRSRIPVVAARTHIGSARLQEAQDAVGLSNESVARKIPVSEKTWRRWKAAGEIPTASLPAVATALRLELRTLADELSQDPVAAEAGDIRDLRVLVDALLRVEGLDPEQILRDSRLAPEEPQQDAEDLEPPAAAGSAA